MEVKVGMPVTRLAKWKTGFQMTALSMMLLKGFWYWGGIGEVLLWIAGVLTFITGYQYFQKSLDYICRQNKAAGKVTLQGCPAEKAEPKKAAGRKTATGRKSAAKSVKTKRAAAGKAK